jgi:CheY-like chemotaxis protein
MAQALRNKAQAGSADARPTRAESRRRVLVAEDHEDTRLLLRLLLEKLGVDVLEAADGEEAVRLILDAGPDLVLIDGGLPRMDGVAVTRRVRAQEPARRVPIVFLSGHAEPLARTAAFDAGCDEYLVKPDGLGDLGSMLERHLGGRRQKLTGVLNQR